MSIHSYTAQIQTANPNLNGTGTMSTLVVGTNPGTVVDEVTINATGTTTAGMIRMFIYDGTNTRLHSQIPVKNNTPSATSASWGIVLRPLNLKLYLGQELRLSTEKAETFHVTASVTIL